MTDTMPRPTPVYKVKLVFEGRKAVYRAHFPGVDASIEFDTLTEAETAIRFHAEEHGERGYFKDGGTINPYRLYV